jgi:two-component system, cell cycle response regulator
MSGDADDVTTILDVASLERPETERNRAYLIVLAGSNVGEMVPLDDELTLGRGAGAGLRLQDEGISRVHCKISQDHFGDVYVEDLDSSNGTFCNGERVTRQLLADGDKIQIGRTAILKFTYHDQLDESFQRKMFDSALRDSLTRAYNKRYFTDRLDSELRFALRHHSPLALLLIDLDHFKNINDTYGHLAGDDALITFASHVHRSIRNEDVFARYGGEEFAIISRGISRQDAAVFAERLRREIAALVVEADDASFSITASIGVATIPESRVTSPEELIKAADAALYRAKTNGRDQVALSEPEALDGSDEHD